MEDSELLAYAAIGLLIYFAILYAIISSAVKSAAANQNHTLIMQNRLLIKMLRKQGVSKQELVALYNQDNDQFWNSVEP